MVNVELIKNTIDELSEKLENALEKGAFNEARGIVREIRRFFEGLLTKEEDPYWMAILSLWVFIFRKFDSELLRDEILLNTIQKFNERLKELEDKVSRLEKELYSGV